MKKTSTLTRLALAGIAAGLVSAAPAKAHDHGKSAGDSARTEKSGCKGKAAVKAGSDKNSCGGAGGCGAKTTKADKAALDKKVAVDTVKQAASCRGKNACKGQGGCAMSDKQIEKRAKELGIPRDKAGKAHSCKGKNECKGLGGCNM